MKKTILIAIAAIAVVACTSKKPAEPEKGEEKRKSVFQYRHNRNPAGDDFRR